MRGRLVLNGWSRRAEREPISQRTKEALAVAKARV
jgi:hypothetical protein